MNFFGMKTEEHKETLKVKPDGVIFGLGYVEDPEDSCIMSSEETTEEVEAYMGVRDNRGVGVVEVILILVVLIALVTIFKSQLTSLVNNIFSTITNNAGAVMS